MRPTTYSVHVQVEGRQRTCPLQIHGGAPSVGLPGDLGASFPTREAAEAAWGRWCLAWAGSKFNGVLVGTACIGEHDLDRRSMFGDRRVGPHQRRETYPRGGEVRDQVCRRQSPTGRRAGGVSDRRSA